MRRGLRDSIALLVLCALLAGCGKGGETAQHGPGTTKGKPSTSPLAAASAIATGNTTRIGGASVAEDAAAVAEAVYPGLTASTRPRAVVLVGSEDWAGALSASALSGAPLHAPILYSGSSVPAVTTQALAAMKPTGASKLRGAEVIAVGEVSVPTGYKTYRIHGSNPFELSAKLAALVVKLHQGHVSQAIIASADGQRALAMPAAGLAAESGAPLLLVEADAVPSSTSAELERLGRPAIYAVGPTASIGEAALKSLERLGETRRLGGGDAVQNAIEVAAYTNGSFGWGVQEPGHGLVFARANRPFDAPAAALLSASADYGPLLLLTEEEGIPLPLRRYLRDIQPGYTEAPESLPVRGVYNHGWLIGDVEAISLTAQAQLDSLLRSVLRQSSYPAPKISP